MIAFIPVRNLKVIRERNHEEDQAHERGSALEESEDQEAEWENIRLRINKLFGTFP